MRVYESAVPQIDDDDDDAREEQSRMDCHLLFCLGGLRGGFGPGDVTGDSVVVLGALAKCLL